MSDQYEKELADRISLLIQKYHEGSLTEAEAETLEIFMNESAENRALIERLMDNKIIRQGLKRMQGYDRPYIQEPEEAVPLTASPAKPTPSILLRFAVAASLLLAMFLAWQFAISPRIANNKTQYADAAATQDALPATSRARLVLSTGESIDIDSMASEMLAQEGNTRINMTAKGQIEYLTTETTTTTANNLYNTITVPRAGIFNLVLSDGTKVWINNASELRYPVAFGANERRVILKGEAFFEVAKNANKPFIVELPHSKIIKVLGTTFNTRAYTDETALTTTLVEGSVQLTSQDNTTTSPLRTLTLRPGEEATLLPGSNNMVTRKPRILSDSYAWRTGLFHFEGENIQSAMTQIARWYDVKIVYEGTPPDDEVSGELYRTLPLSSVLKSLEKISSGRYEIKEKTVIVRKTKTTL